MRDRISRREKFFDDKEELSAFVRAKGLKGLTEREARNFFHLSHSALLSLCLQLEEEGQLKIISFSPLFLLSRESLDFLSQKILAHISQFHKKHPKEKGISFPRIKKRFDLPRKILMLALKTLIHAGEVREEDSVFALSSFSRLLTPREEKLLSQLEEMCRRGEFRSLTLKDFQTKFHLPQPKLQQLLSLLVERKKIIQGKDEFFLHSSWLESLMARIKKMGKKELTVSEFKTMTGLSRKYAIPLLELLDEMGVTRRKGSVREII